MVTNDNFNVKLSTKAIQLTTHTQNHNRWLKNHTWLRCILRRHCCGFVHQWLKLYQNDKKMFFWLHIQNWWKWTTVMLKEHKRLQAISESHIKLFKTLHSQNRKWFKFSITLSPPMYNWKSEFTSHKGIC